MNLIFVIRNTRLEYTPRSGGYCLPELVEVAAPDADKSRGFRLIWPGFCSVGYDGIPASILRHWSNRRESTSLADLVESKDRNDLPDDLPWPVAYHLAVNRTSYRLDDVPRGIGALTPQAALFTLDQTFYLDNFYLDALGHLREQAEIHRNHAKLQPFDTVVRDELLQMCSTPTYLYFYLLGDSIRPVSDESAHWFRFALYLHWLGEVGAGLLTTSTYARWGNARFQNIQLAQGCLALAGDEVAMRRRLHTLMRPRR